MPKKVLILDGNSIVNRAFYATPLLTNSEGYYTNAVYGFLNMLFKFVDEETPDYVAVAFDLPKPTFRHIKFEEYKGKRKKAPFELIGQIPLLKEVLLSMNIKTYEKEGYEADDILGTISKKAEDKGYDVVIISGDRDLLQLASKTVKIRIPKTKAEGSKIEDYYEDDIIAKYGVTPREFIEVKALMGDSSDSIPSISGIGEKIAIKIIQQYKTVESAIKNASSIKYKKASENLAKYSEQAKLNHLLVKIVRDVPIEIDFDTMKYENIFNEKAYEVFKRLEFKSMFGRFEKTAEFLKSGHSEINSKIILTQEDLNNFIPLLNENVETAYFLFTENEKICGISVYNDEVGSIWVEKSQDLSDNYIAEKFKNFFENISYKKIGNDIKKDIKIFKNYGINVSKVIFDTAIGAYIINSTKNAYEYNDLAGEFLNQGYPSVEELLGKGKNKKSIFDLSSDIRLEFCASFSYVIFKTKYIIDKKLEENEQTKLYYDIELPLIYVLADMEKYGIKIDEDKLKEYQKELETKINIITDEIYSIAGEKFNINSPKQLGVILFEKLKIKGGKKTKSGYSTAAEILEKHKNENIIIEKVLYYRQLAKLKSTYADGLLNVMDKNTKKIYSTFNQTITATGRISSTDPNLQNIPIRLELGRNLRKVFIPESDEFCFVDADYSQIELRILAAISEDKTLIEAFNQNQDIHRLTASQVFNVPFDEVTPLQRSNAKAVNFGIIYGISSFSLSEDLSITKKDAEKYINQYFEKYPNIKKYMDNVVDDAKDTGYVSTLFNRRRYMPELKSKNFMQRSFGERAAMNMPIQGTSADIIKIAMIKVHDKLIKKGLKSRLILQVHDELLVETHRDEIEIVKDILKNEMEQAVKISVPLDIDIHEGDTWFEAK